MIRVATKEDFDIVKAFVPNLIRDSVYGKFFKGYSLTPFMFHQYTTRLREKICIIVEDENKPIGFAMFDLVPWLFIDREVKFARISFVYIDEEFRGKGYMDNVVEAFEHWGKEVGAHYYTVGTKMPKKGYVKAETIYMKEVK